MKFFKFFITLGITLTIIYFFNNRIKTESGHIPPIGKFLNPYQGFWQNAEESAFSLPENINLSGLKEEVTIKYDENLIPHIFAANKNDLYTSAGFVAANHRLWQLELVTYNAAGRLSEIIGPATIDLDKEQRRLGMLWSAEKVIKEWEKNPEINEMLEAYANGINQYIQSLEYKDYPLEYKLLDYKPEEWTKLKSALVLKYMSKLLTIRESDIENTNFLSLYGLEAFNKLFPEFPEGIDPIIPEEKDWGFEYEYNSVPDSLFSVPLIARVYEKPFSGLGSNNWAVSAEKSSTGKAILANDMHLNLTIPSIWFVVQYHTPEFNAYGHILPGTPMIIQGFNDSIAWGMTNAYRDLVDWYQIEFKNNSRNQYLYDGRWLHTKKEIEIIKVRGQEDQIDTVVYTHHGPIVYDRNYLAKDSRVNLAMKWLAHQVSFEPLCFNQLLEAKNYADFKSAIKHFSCPPQNLIFAGKSGDVAIHAQGNYPIKYPDQGKFVLDGTSSQTEWQGYIPFEENPQIYNPDRNFVSSANQHPTDDDYPYYIYSDNHEYYRNRRINEVLDSIESVSLKDFENLHLDNFNIKGREILPLLLDSLSENIANENREVFSLLENWDYEYKADSKGAAYFEMWWKELYTLIWDELINAELALPNPSTYNTYLLMKNEPDLKFFDVKDTPEKEALSDLINRSFTNFIEKVEEWESSNPDKELTRSTYYSTDIMHYARIEAFSAMDLPVGGNGDVVNAITYTHGPSERIIIEMDKKGPKAWHTYPGGQSGNPGNPHYDKFLQSWIEGRYFPALFMKNVEDEQGKIQFIQTMNPE